jgi:hypothetical protein
LSGDVYGEFETHKSAHFAANRQGYFHYNLHVHRYNMTSWSSGVAELPGDDLVVSLQCAYNDTEWVRNTILHELGHNLFLQHGGFEYVNDKPNYNSVMNYRFQFSGVDTTCDALGDGPADYSRGTRITLDENSLNEAAGVCGNVAIDWNYSNTIQNNIAYDLNFDGTNGQLTDYNDWANLSFQGPSVFRTLATARVVSCDPAPLP